MTIIKTVTFSIECPICGKEHFVTVGEEGFRKWQNGEMAQDAFPYLSLSEREQIISNICPECQVKIFKDDEDEDIDISDFEDDEGDDISDCMAESLAFTGQWW